VAFVGSVEVHRYPFGFAATPIEDNVKACPTGNAKAGAGG